MIWYQQLVHHDIWDYDMPPHPILINLTVDGKPVRAVVQLTKQAFAYVFDRTNGQPVFGWTEKPVPQTDVPKEWTSPTQPFPNKPPAFDLQGITLDDLIDFTPALRAEAIEAIKPYKLGPIYTPGTLGGRTATRERSSCQVSAVAPTGRVARRIRRQGSSTWDRRRRPA